MLKKKEKKKKRKECRRGHSPASQPHPLTQTPLYCGHSHLVPDQSHDANPCEYVLPADWLSGDTITVAGGVGQLWLTQVTHEQVHIATEHTHTHQKFITTKLQHLRMSNSTTSSNTCTVCHLLEHLLWNGLEFPHLPGAVEGISRRHAISHHRVKEPFTLSRVETKHLFGREGGERMTRKIRHRK